MFLPSPPPSSSSFLSSCRLPTGVPRSGLGRPDLARPQSPPALPRAAVQPRRQSGAIAARDRP
eukprot:1157624-Pyramimonas_sp.AAC.1